jgi:hypothetical protein
VGEKCFGYLLDYRWLEDGSWEYYAPDGIDLKVCNSDGTIESIALLGADEARVTLGIATTPSGNDWHHLNAPGKHSDKWRSVKTKTENWLSCLRNAISRRGSAGSVIGFSSGLVSSMDWVFFRHR